VMTAAAGFREGAAAIRAGADDCTLKYPTLAGTIAAVGEAVARASLQSQAAAETAPTIGPAARALNHPAEDGSSKIAEIRQKLSPKQWEICLLVADGLSNNEIASRLRRSANTVAGHLKGVYTKLGVSGRDELRKLLIARSRAGRDDSGAE
jgi:DNA-binding NarL/FixJ family response regulator